MNIPTNMGLSAYHIDQPRPKCDRYCKKHPMVKCDGVLNHRGFHQCVVCEHEGIKKGWNITTPQRYPRWFEYE